MYSIRREMLTLNSTENVEGDQQRANETPHPRAYDLRLDASPLRSVFQPWRAWLLACHKEISP